MLHFRRSIRHPSSAEHITPLGSIGKNSSRSRLNCSILLAFPETFQVLRFHDAKMKSDEARRGSRRKSNQLESIIATVASRFMAMHGVFRKNGVDGSSKQDA
jgi:hypothetical protein